jgi:hypothetical protein
MTLERIACVSVGILIASTHPAGQQASAPPAQATPATSVAERSYPAGVRAQRTVQTRNVTGDREVVTETTEAPGIDGRLAPFQETVSETVRIGPGASQTRRQVVNVGPQRQRRLLETTQTEQEGAADAGSTIHNTSAPDLNGRLGATSRRVDTTSSVAPDSRRSDSTLFLPGIEGTLQEATRAESTERQLGPGVGRHDSTQLDRDVNGRWQSTETRSREVREIGPTERLEQETIQRLDSSGRLTVSERKITRRTESNGRTDEVSETHAPGAGGFVLPGNRSAVVERVRKSTTPTADGGRVVVEEVEARSRVAPSDPMRVMRRTVETVRRIGPDRWTTTRQVFGLDVNGRLTLVLTETEESAGR